MKRTQFLLITAAIAAFMMGVSTFTACDKDDDKKDNAEQTNDNKQDKVIPAGYVDLGLPSGTLWKTQNEDGFFSYEEAINVFGNQIPTKEQLEEIDTSCTWNWTGSGYKVTGPNGNFITLPAAGYRYYYNGQYADVEGEGSIGGYWSSTPEYINGHILAYNLSFNIDDREVNYGGVQGGHSVRLVTK